MVKLTCLIRRKDGDVARGVPRVLARPPRTARVVDRSGSHVLRYEQHHRPLSDYGPDDDGQYDGVTEQWFESMEEYQAHIAEKDFADVWADLPKFLDVDRLAFVVTEEPVVILAGR